MTLTLILGLLKRFWWAIPVIAAAVWIAGLHEELSHTRNTLAVVKGDLTASKALGAAQTKKALETQHRWELSNVELTNDAKAKLDAAAADHDSLAKRLRNAELRASQVPAVSSGGPVDAGAGGKPASTAELDAAFDAYDRACQRDAIRLNYYDQRETELERPF